MPTRYDDSRRQFLKTAAAGTGSVLLVGRLPAATLPAGGPTEGETPHFWYRLAPPSPYIDSQRGNKAFGFQGGRILLSEDNGQSWPHIAEFPNAENITFSCILQNGNILFATRTRLYLSRDNLRTYRQITVQDRSGNDYLPHKPMNPDRPGWYFHPLDGVHTWDVSGREMLVWGNYCNVLGGAVPVNIWYSADQGETVKIAYSFGQNPRFQDGDGTADTLLGDPHNPLICRHVHSVAYNSAEGAFYACTGDGDVDGRHECHWLRGVYDTSGDRWDWQVRVSVDSNSRYKSGGINFVDGQLYWAADANGPVPSGAKHDRGIFRCDPADLAEPTKHTLLFNPEYESANMIIEDGVILSAHYAPASPYQTGLIISPDMGRTWAQYDLEQFGPTSPVRFQKKNSDGWFKVDLRQGWIGRDKVLFLKPKV
jgi:hypothetical protein